MRSTEAQDLNSRPLVRTQDGFIIGAPGLLLHALRLRILALAEQTGLLRELAERFADGCWAGVARSLTYLSHDELGQPPLDPGLPAFRHGLFSLDTDKALYVQLASDPLNDYSGQSPDSWHDDQLMGSLQAHAGAVEQDIFSGNSPRMRFCSCTCWFLLDEFVTGLKKTASPELLLQPFELDVIAQLDGGDLLTLLRYAAATDELREHMKVFVFSQLDEYHIFRKHHYSYYLSDETPPDVYITPGTGLELQTGSG